MRSGAFRFIMRLYVQFEVRAILDFGSDFFHRLFTEFNRPICTLVQDIRFVNASFGDDPINGARLNIVRDADLFATTTGRPAQVLALAPAFARFMAGPTCVVKLLAPGARAAVQEAARRRFATDPSARATALVQVGLGGFLLGEIDPAQVASEADGGCRDRGCLVAPARADLRHHLRRRAVRSRCAGSRARGVRGRAVAGNPGDSAGGVLERAGAAATGFTWLEPHRVQDRIGGCVDLMILGKVEPAVLRAVPRRRFVLPPLTSVCNGATMRTVRSICCVSCSIWLESQPCVPWNALCARRVRPWRSTSGHWWEHV